MYEDYKYYIDHVPNTAFNYFHLGMVMAIEHHYPRANYDVYKSVVDLHHQNGIDEIDPRTMDLALFFLERGVSENDSMSIAEWIKMRPNGRLEVDSIKANFHKRFIGIHERGKDTLITYSSYLHL